MNLALQPIRWPFTLEKWYIDTLLPDGEVLLVYLAQMVIFGFRIARVTTELFTEEGVVRGAARASSIKGEEDHLDFGPAQIDGEMLIFDTGTIAGELRYQPRHPSVELRDPFLSLNDRRLSWTVEIPDADVQGVLRLPDGERRISGRGYRDRVYFDFEPWRFPLQELRWGRAVCGAHAATWVAAAGQEAVEVVWADGVVSEGGFEGQLGDETTLLDTDVFDLEGLTLGPIGPILRRIAKDPHETKWAASASIQNVAGRAIHEVVRWR